ncbi:MAG: serine/threonine protein kinase, partial [bacterium]
MSRKLGNYEVLDEIGRGGMAIVYKARQRSLDRIVAIKELDLKRSASDPRAGDRFELEAKAAASLHHPSIITVHDFWERG